MRTTKEEGAILGILTEQEIDAILRRQRIGRIGSTAVGYVNITPIVYGYDGEAIYGNSRFGHKIQYMRGNREVCFEVEEIEDPSAWRVVLLSGVYEELADIHERDRAMRLILTQADGGPESESVRVDDPATLVIFRLKVGTRSGHYERSIESQPATAELVE